MALTYLTVDAIGSKEKARLLFGLCDCFSCNNLSNNSDAMEWSTIMSRSLIEVAKGALFRG